MQTAAVTVNIADITIDPLFQMRVALNQDTIVDYCETITSSESAWPFNEPCTLFNVSGELILVDGFHRVAGMKTAGRDTIEATIVDGTRTDALLAAIGSNQTHGLRRNSEDKRRCVTTAFGDELLSAMSDRQLAELCGVSQPFVSRIRSELITVITSEVIGADGKAYPTAAVAKANRAEIAKVVASNPDDSNVKIAEAVGVSDKTVASVRQELAGKKPAKKPQEPMRESELRFGLDEVGMKLDKLRWRDIHSSCIRVNPVRVIAALLGIYTKKFDAKKHEGFYDELRSTFDKYMPKVAESEAQPTEVHPVLALFLEMEGHNFDELKSDIELYGQRLPIVIDDSGLVLDGRARLKACKKLGISPKIEVFRGSEADKIALIRSLNICRSNLDPSQQSMYSAHLVGMQSAMLGVQE